MDIDNIKYVLNHKSSGIIGEDREYAKYSIMIPILKIDGKLNILFQVRAKTLRRQPGEISFPGGSMEKGESSIECAIREFCEELNISKQDFEVIGATEVLITPHNKIIYPYVCYVRDINKINPSKYEVDHVFYAPIDYFINNLPIVKTSKIVTVYEEDLPYGLGLGGDYKWDVGRNEIYFYKYNDYKIWGITAKILHNFISKI